MTDKQLIVDANDPSCFATIGEAIEDAVDGEKITIRPGEYRENLIVEKQVHLIGDGAVEDVRIIGDGESPVIISRSPLLNLRNLTLVNSSGAIATLECESGICDIKYCAIRGGNHGLSAFPSTRLVLENSAVAGCVSGGVYGNECVNLTVADTLIEKCGGSGIIAEECHEVFVERCSILDVSLHGIVANGGAAFEVKETEISGTSEAPILDNNNAIKDGSDRLWYERRSGEEE